MRRALIQTDTVPPPEPPSLDLRPATEDATLAAIRPAGRCIATLRVGPTQTYATITSATTAAVAAQTARAASEGVAIGNTSGHPDFRVDILVDSGTYPETVKGGKFIGIYSATGIPGDVVVTGAASELGCLYTQAGSVYVEGITFWRGNIDGVAAANLPKYPHHHASYGKSSIFANCHFHSEVIHPVGGWTAIGMDGSDGGYVLWYGCKLTASIGGTQTNLHGWASNTVPSNFLFVNADAPTAQLQYDSLHGSLADEFWVVGGECGSIDTSGAGVVLHYDPASTSGAVTPSGPSDNDTDWPVPVGGLTAAEHALYYPY